MDVPQNEVFPDDLEEAILELFLDDEGKKDWAERIQAGGENGPGYGHIKKAIMEHMDASFGEAREAYQALLEGDRKDEVDEVLAAGAKRARGVAVEVLDRCREACGIGDTIAILMTAKVSPHARPALLRALDDVEAELGFHDAGDLADFQLERGLGERLHHLFG